MQKGYVINGKFLTQRITGVQRYAIELLNALDEMDLPNPIEIAVPPDAEEIPPYKKIHIVRTGRFSGNLWEQISFPLYALHHQRIPVNLCNASPLLFPGIVCVHDIKIKVHPEYFSLAFQIWYRLLFGNCMRRAKKVITVSEFSKTEISRFYRKPPEEIDVVPSCWEHYARIPYDENALEKYHLSPKRYLFALGSLDPNKNFRWIARAAVQNPGFQFAIAGGINKSVFSCKEDFACPENMQFLGRVTDEEAKTLMRECYAFLFPSFYEGFGLPPLEAMAAGAQSILVSEIPVMREIFEDTVNYTNPSSENCDLTALRRISEEQRKKMLAKFSWKESARKFNSILEIIMKA